jgi:glucose/arabinose dehydrogenase
MTIAVFRRLLLAAGVSLPFAAPVAAYQAVPVGSFNQPIDMRVAPGQPRTLYVAEQPGKIFVLRNEVRFDRPFLDIEDLVQSGGEEGLLSFAFAPDYQTSRRFYVFYVNTSGNVQVDEFKRSSSDPLRVPIGSRRPVIEIPHPGASNHNGGQVHFGPDGYLYIAIGDGGNTSTPGEPARRLNSLLGKILRIDPLPSGSSAYRSPPDNPFVGRPGRDEIYSYGLRNPYRFSLDRGLIAIGDVGQQEQEEVDILKVADAKGVNFGWPEFEGDLPYDADLPGPDPAVFPIHVYSHDDGCAIIGGVIVHDPQLPELKNRYLYGDFCQGELRSFKPNVAEQIARDDKPIGLTISGLTSFGAGTEGQVYVTNGSTLFRLEP